VPLDHSQIGRRVVIRSLVRGEKGPSGGPLMTDVIGYLREYGAGVAVVERRDGSLTQVAIADIVAAKPVPPPPPPRPPRWR
jgi:N-acetylglutamate synthase